MKGKKNLRTAQHTGRRSANSLGCSTAQCTEKMNSGMREGVWNYRGKEAVQAWTLLCLSSPSLSLPVRGDFGKYEEWDGQAKFTWQHPISGARKESWRGSRGWVPDLKENPEGYLSHINSSRQRDILAGDAVGRENWREVLLSELELINALGTKGLLSCFTVLSYSPVCPWQQVKKRQ